MAAGLANTEFVLFDVEVIFFFPWAVVFRSLGVPGLIEMIVFIVILEVAYVYAWKTPLARLLPTAGPGYTMIKANAMRMEPVL